MTLILHIVYNGVSLSEPHIDADIKEVSVCIMFVNVLYVFVLHFVNVSIS